MNKYITRKDIRLAVLAIFTALVGCASTAPVKYTELSSSPKLQPNTASDEGRIPYKYAAPVDWKKYNKINIQPVVIYQGHDGQFNDMDMADRLRLANYMQQKFSEVLGKRFENSTQPSGSALRLTLTLTGADTTPQVVGTVTKFDLAGGPYNIVQSIRGGRGMLSGYVNYAVEVHDASTNALLLAYVGEQYPNAMNVGASVGSLSAAETGIDKAADELLNMLQ